jgi:sec-independent protein translocase protein TatA
MLGVAPMLPLASFLSPSFGELMVIGIIALLVYGSDLPKVIRSWGKTYSEFRRHLNSVRNELNDAMYAEDDSPRKLQYYPEFQHEANDGDGEQADDQDSPVAQAAANAEKAAQGDAAGDETVRHDTHGAA